ncbi:DUF998 domain-containing protein [Streptomyces sp. LaBMicrA B280]|uniref:DUF998 domain-containing protein n=1 Tax=Streptomyces sp. LaBMicrA B280 TaxID=3391001 RepID=UPI003BA4DCC9
MDARVQKISRRSRWAGALLILAGVQYVVLEYLTASAWHRPSYSYAVNFISDLGNPVAGDVFAGRRIDSPLHLVMDAAFITQGTLFITAAALLLGTAAARRGRWLFGLAIAHGVGVILVGLFHESAAALHNGVIVGHSIGAAVTILAGNVIALMAGADGPRVGAPRPLRRAATALGILGLAAFALLQLDRPLYDTAGGVPERIAVYTILAFEVLVGGWLLARRPRPPLDPPVLGVFEERASRTG